MSPGLWLALTFCLLIIACGGGDATLKEQPSTLPPAPVVEPDRAGGIEGKVEFTGAKPETVFLSMDAVPSCARQHKSAVPVGDVIVNPNGTLKNVLVRIKAGLGQYQWPVPREAALLDQQGCLYQPRVVAVMVGQPLQITNSDPSNHNINFMAQNNPPFNESQPPQGEAKIKIFEKPEVMVTVRCNVHPWMRAYVGIIEHPYFEVTRDEGAYSFEGLSPGDYVLETWHEKYGRQEQNITVEAGAVAVTDFTYPR